MANKVDGKRDLAFYYPNWMWSSGDWIKNLILFFDGIALLVPNYMGNLPEEVDPAIVAGLKQYGLLEIIEPEKAVDKSATEKLATALTDIIASGALDDLAREQTAFGTISRSRMGYGGDQALAEMIVEDLKKRGLAKDSEDGISIPMHPRVRSLVLVLLAQILRPYGAQIGANLSPATDVPKMVQALTELMTADMAPSAGRVIEFDLNAVTVDLGPFPIDEVLDFRKQNLEAHRRYSLSVRKFAMQLSRMSEAEQKEAFELRQAELDDLANDLRKRARKAWKKPVSFALTLAGAAFSLISAPIAAALGVAGAIADYGESDGIAFGPYSYLFSAKQHFLY
ncbi:MAG TPA: hypothetical protein VJN94_09210 [Candidatus Binataceae bacterium]|nr:hypothetical protein [Candidatus Binataceae bacterium]